MMSLLVRSFLARDPVCLLCNGTRIRRSSRPYGTVMGAVFVAVRCQECGRRFPLRRRVASTRVTLVNRVATAQPNRKAIEGVVEDALRSVPGDWVVEIRAGQDPRWLLSIRRPGRGDIRLALAPDMTAADQVYERVRESLRKEGLV